MQAFPTIDFLNGPRSPFSFSHDFASGRLPAGATFAGGNNGSYRDGAGGVQLDAANVPGFGYVLENGIWRLKGVLVEDGISNFFLNSGTPASHTSPSLGTGTYTLSLEGAGSIEVAANTATGTGFDTATDGTPVTFTITGGGTVDFTVTGSPTRAQCTDTSYVSSYIPTAGASVARTADQLSMPVSAIPGYRQHQGTFYIEFHTSMTLAASAQDYFLSLVGSSALEQASININHTNSDRFEFAWRVGGTFDSTLTVTGPAIGNTSYRAAIAFGPDGDNRILCVDGVLSSPDASASVPDIVTMWIGAFSAGSGECKGFVRRVAYSPLRLPDAKLQELTG